MIGQMNLFDVVPSACVKEWKYDEDTESVMCRCPDCEGRLYIGPYIYWNPYHYCPYCGIQLNEGKITKKRVQVYGTELETELKVRREYGKG